MANICYIFVYVFECIISFIYFENKYILKTSKVFTLTSYFIMFSIQYLCNFIGIPNLNLAIFFLTNFLISIICYQSNILQSIFNSVLITVLMLTSELCVFYICKLLFHTDILSYSTNSAVLLVEASASKLLYFLLAFIISKISIKEKRIDFKSTNTIFLFLLPIASILLLMGIAYTTENYELSNYVYIIFSISTVLLIYSNIIVFWVHEFTLKTQYENTELRLQQQKSEIDKEYYSILQQQYENSNILIHDIKRHLLSIKELLLENSPERINQYIDNLYTEYQIKYIKKYSDNKLINAIVNRYVAVCKENSIDFHCDIRNIDFSFITDNNITSLFDNLLENAVEASLNALDKKIELTVKQTNTNFVAINIWNYSLDIPNLKNGKLITTKENKLTHGYGIKSIERIVREYNGNINFSFDKDTMKFTSTVVLKIKQ